MAGERKSPGSQTYGVTCRYWISVARLVSVAMLIVPNASNVVINDGRPGWGQRNCVGVLKPPVIKAFLAPCLRVRENDASFFWFSKSHFPMANSETAAYTCGQIFIA